MTRTAAIFGTERHLRCIALFRYVLILAAMSLVWEFAQMPLYTLGQAGTVGEITYAALHCTAGDAIIGGFSLLAALFSFGAPGWPREGRVRVLVAALALGLSYTVVSEWLNVELRGSWAYSEFMPIVPFVGTGLAPLLQWVVIPVAAYLCVLSTRNGSRDEAARAPTAPRAPAGPPAPRGDGSWRDEATESIKPTARDLASARAHIHATRTVNMNI